MSQRTKGKRFTEGQLGNTRGHLINGAARKDERRKEAMARQTAWRALPIAERLKRLPAEGATRERARLQTALVKQTEKASQPQKGKKEQQQTAAKKAA